MPYLLLGITWAFTNPPGAAPDESDHLVKALGAGRLQVGEEYSGPVADDGPAATWNASVSRDLEIPAVLAPDGYSCTAFRPEQTGACLPDRPVAESGTVLRTTVMGAYPIFGYVPLGVVARFAHSPGGAFVAGRLASLLMSMTLLFGGTWHLVRWLGRASASGLVLMLTPMTVFTSASVSTSGLEIMAAVALGCVVVVVSRDPGSLTDRRTIALAAAAASALTLSRQLGVVTLCVFTLLALARGGARVIWSELRRGRPEMWVAGVVVVGSSAALIAWQLAFDHSSTTGGLVNGRALRAFFADQLYHYVVSGVGQFGWLDTPLPGVAIGAWVALASLVGGAALVFGGRADRWSLTFALACPVLVAYALHATIFYGAGFGVQGRHLLPMFSIVPILAGVVVVETIQEIDRPDAAKRLILGIATVMASLQLLSLLVNARRYAVGGNGPVIFVADAEWSPHLGWIPWLLLGMGSSIWLAVVTIRGIAHRAGGTLGS